MQRGINTFLIYEAVKNTIRNPIGSLYDRYRLMFDDQIKLLLKQFMEVLNFYVLLFNENITNIYCSF